MCEHWGDLDIGGSGDGAGVGEYKALGSKKAAGSAALPESRLGMRGSRKGLDSFAVDVDGQARGAVPRALLGTEESAVRHLWWCFIHLRSDTPQPVP